MAMHHVTLTVALAGAREVEAELLSLQQRLDDARRRLAQTDSSTCNGALSLLASAAIAANSSRRVTRRSFLGLFGSRT